MSMKKITINDEGGNYSVYLGSNFLSLTDIIKKNKLDGRKIVIISDKNVAKIYLDEIHDIFADICKNVYDFIIEPGESSKNLSIISKFYEFLISVNADRKTFIVALGGGVVGDFAGFAASTYMRGIGYVQIPTSLLAQVDSSVGGKVGVDFLGYKNMIGAFYKPIFVYINSNTLNTLPEREYSAGMAEVIKYGIILDKDFYKNIVKFKEEIKSSKKNDYIINKSIKYKSKIVEKDEKESGVRAVLNFGHTIGHAVERLKDFELLHGECVAIGMVSALFICKKRGSITKKQFKKFIELLEFFNLPVKVAGVDAIDVYENLFQDKKSTNGDITFVLIKEIGDYIITKDVVKSDIMNAINFVISGSR